METVITRQNSTRRINFNDHSLFNLTGLIPNRNFLSSITIRKISFVSDQMNLRLDGIRKEFKAERRLTHEKLKEELWCHLMHLKGIKDDEELMSTEFKKFVKRIYSCFHNAEIEFDAQIMGLTEKAYKHIWTVINHYKFNSNNSRIRRKMELLKGEIHDKLTLLKRNFRQDKREFLLRRVKEISKYLEYNIDIPKKDIQELVKCLNQEINRITS